MFGNFKRRTYNKELEGIIHSLEVNASNNYKDAAQKNLRQFEEAFESMVTSGKLNEKQRAYYEEKLNDYKQQMKEFTHKDQKPYWV